MTDRFKGLTVVLDGDYRTDDAQAIIDAISMIKGVIKVVPSVTSMDDLINRERISMELQTKLFEVLHPGRAKK